MGGNVGTAKNLRRNAKNLHDFCKTEFQHPYTTYIRDIHKSSEKRRIRILLNRVPKTDRITMIDDD